MAILELVLNLGGASASIFGAIDAALRRFSKSTAEELFKKSFINAVEQNASHLAELTETGNSKTVEVDINMLDSVITSLKDNDISALTSLEENEKLTEITNLFHKCIMLPGHQLTTTEFVQRIRPVIERTIADFYSRLPLNQEAFNQIVFKFMQTNAVEHANQAEIWTLLRDFLDKFEKANLEVQQRVTEHTQAIKADTDEIKETTQATFDVSQKMNSQLTRFLNDYYNESRPDAVATEHQSAIDNARDLLKEGRPQSALNLLENLKQRVWPNADGIIKFRILTNMAAAQFALNKVQEGALLLIEALQYNPDDEAALSNCALAYLLLGETDEAVTYVRKTLEKNPVNTSAYAVLVGISTEEETLEEVIAKVPKHLRETPQIADAISQIARQRRDFEEAKKWGEIMVANEQENVSNYKAALATILVDQVLDNRLAVLTKQLDDSQQEQLRRAIELFTEAWNCVANTELRTVWTDWIINRSTAHVHLGELKEAIKDLDTALEIEPSNLSLRRKRAVLAFEQGEYKSAIEFLEEIRSAPETPENTILLANILLEDKRFNEAITTLNNFLVTNPPLELQENANRLLIRIYIADKNFDKARQISTAIREASPTSVLNLVDAARISKATGESDEALSQLKEAYSYALNSESIQEVLELADELCTYEQFEEAATLYEKVANTSLNSQWTERLLYSYYRSGERKKALDICQALREQYGPLKNISEMEFLIYNEIGDMNQARAVCEVYINAFPDDADMQIHLGIVHYRSNNLEEVDRLLEKSFDLQTLSLRSYFDLAYLYRIRSQPEKALDIMYEARRTHYNDAEAHLKYIGLFFTVNTEIDELLHPNQVETGIAVRLDSSDPTNWYIIEEREDADSARKELNVDDPLAKRLLGKTVNDEILLRQNPIGSETAKIVDIKSKYVYSFQEICRTFSELFPDNPGLWSVNLDDSREADDSEKMQPIFDFITQQHEASLEIENIYKENPLPIGAFTNLTGGNVLEALSLLMRKPDLGVKCSAGHPEEWRQALATLEDGQSKLVVDLIALITIHEIGAADTVIKAFGTLSIAQSTIDELESIITQREMLSKQEGMSVGKEGDQYVKTDLNPEDIRRNVEYLTSIIKWIWENCEVDPCTRALEMNQLRKQEFYDLFQPLFVDTILIASQPGYLLFSDDERLRFYAKTNFGIDAGTDFHVDGVWTQVVLQHCVNRNLLDKVEYDKMTIKLVCSHYYHTTFDTDVLIEAARQSDWKPDEPYNTLVQTLGDQSGNLLSALNVAVDFLFELWIQPILVDQRKSLTFRLLDELTSGQEIRAVLIALANRISNRSTLRHLAKQDILLAINTYAQTHLS